MAQLRKMIDDETKAGRGDGGAVIFAKADMRHYEDDLKKLSERSS